MTRLTRNGWAVAASGPLLLAAGILAGYPFLAGLGLAAFAAIVGAIAITLVRYRISASREVLPDRVTVGGEVRMRLTVTNMMALPTPGFVASVHIGDLRTLEMPVPPLGRRGHGESSVMVSASKRGLIRLSPVAVRRRDPLGLAQRNAGFSAADWLWVHPRVHHLMPLPAGLVLDFEGQAASRSHAGSATFASLREYAEGDDPRHIHWRTTARTGTLTVRHQVDTTEPATAIVIDARSDVLDAASFEEGVEVAASMAAASARAGKPFTLLDSAGAASTSTAGAHNYLDRLAALEQRAGGLDDLLAAVERAAPGGSLAVISGDTPGLIAAISPQRRRFAMVVVILIGSGSGGGVINRRPGMTVLNVQTARELAALWPTVVRSAA